MYNDSDLISCDIIHLDGLWQHRFLAVDAVQVILVEPDRLRLGWGQAKLVASLQDLEVSGAGAGQAGGLATGPGGERGGGRPSWWQATGPGGERGGGRPSWWPRYRTWR
ncbi:unnamed protein product [Plutella xylostella]|uniref:(diamondback moth) hypothetical protein n=1 Tax=Plutella xylostella TaxID=51655 RepID=A0A8S4FYW0_PLUXY|nr:unnamed protein product [Plutella xylostella]